MDTSRSRIQPRSCSHRHGIVALSMVILLALLSLAIAGLVMGGARDQDLAVTRMDTERAFYCAEAGISMGMREASLGADLDGDGGIGSISDDGNAANNPQIGAAAVFVTKAGSAGNSTLTARANAGTATHLIESNLGIDTGGTAPGLWAEYFSGSGTINSISNVNWTAAPTQTTVASQINFSQTSGQSWPGGPTNNWGRRYTGKITVAQSGTWTFYTNSDDGSDVWIDGVRIVNNDGTHAMQTRSGSVALTAGQHDIEIRWFERTGVFGLILYWSGPGVPSQTIVPASALSH